MPTLKFPFNDLRSFKDFVVFVRMCAPDGFPTREGVSADEQWTLELAFLGLDKGLAYVPQKCLLRAKELIDEAHEHYLAGRISEGFAALAEVRKLLAR